MQFDSNTQTQMKKHIKNIEKGITFFSKQMAHNQTKIILIENGGKWINKPTNRQKDRATNKNEAEKIRTQKEIAMQPILFMIVVVPLQILSIFVVLNSFFFFFVICLPTISFLFFSI